MQGDARHVPLERPACRRQALEQKAGVADSVSRAVELLCGDFAAIESHSQPAAVVAVLFQRAGNHAIAGTPHTPHWDRAAVTARPS